MRVTFRILVYAKLQDFLLMLGKVFSKLLIIPIRLYQVTLSPFLGQNCSHIPTCSNYAIEAIKKKGPFKGFWLALKRISKCHPIKILGGGSGLDLVPKKENFKRKN